MNTFFEDDTCWCADSNICNITECFRHLNNRKPHPTPDIFTMASFQNNPDCPYYDSESEGVENEF